MGAFPNTFACREVKQKHISLGLTVPVLHEA